MSLLAARRHALGRDRWRSTPRGLQTAISTHSTQFDCAKNCTNNFTSRTSAECIRNCPNIRKFHLYSTTSTSINNHRNNNNHKYDSQHNDRVKLDEIQEINSITNRDELLDMDESSHVVVVNAKNNNNKYTTNLQTTKDNAVEIEELKTEFKFLPSSTTTTSPDRNNNQTKYGLSAYYVRSKRIEAANNKNRQKNVATTSERSVEETDLLPYLYFGQKLTTVKSNHVQPKRTPTSSVNLPDMKDKSKDELYESVDMLVSRPTSTEKSKQWNNNRINTSNRNIVAFNNAQRRAQSNIVSVPKYETIAPTTLRPTTYNPINKISPIMSTTITTTTNVPTTISTTTTTAAGITEKSNIIPEVDVLVSRFSEFDEIFQTTSPEAIDTKLMNTRSTFNGTLEPEKKHIILPLEINHNLSALEDLNSRESRLEQPTIGDIFNFSESSIIGGPSPTDGVSVLIINVPDIPDTSSVDGETQFSDVWIPELKPQDVIIPLAAFNETNGIFETTTVTQDEAEDSRTFIPVVDINRLFPNINTTYKATNRNSTTTTTTTTTTVKPIITSTTTTTVAPLTSTSTTTTTTSTTTTTPAPTTIKTTTSTSSPSTTKIPVTTSTTTSTTTPVPPITSTTQKSTSPTVPLFNNLTNISALFPHIPMLTNISAIPSPVTTTASKKSTVAFDGMLLHHNNDVTIEMHRMNMATYVLAGLGMFPIVIILMYVIKTLIFKKHNKVTDDLERYIQDGQPISPVVRLEQSDTSSITDESIMTDRDFNRNKLHFKSLLGEGNFGQVWKAEVDDLTGHHGTTRIVAVKSERSGNGQEGLKEEAEIMRKLGSHTNVVTLLGACVEQGNTLNITIHRCVFHNILFYF